ncbi:MAG: hypothetical protein AVDCRST_MAG03-2019, partial [uncultured Rubrobacteraceae bacterium]
CDTGHRRPRPSPANTTASCPTRRGPRARASTPTLQPIGC